MLVQISTAKCEARIQITETKCDLIGLGISVNGNGIARTDLLYHFCSLGWFSLPLYLIYNA
jgi:hypothetical protein